eukprot:1145348-Pelagomonas_calceolata.AAC.4
MAQHAHAPAAHSPTHPLPSGRRLRPGLMHRHRQRHRDHPPAQLAGGCAQLPQLPHAPGTGVNGYMSILCTAIVSSTATTIRLPSWLEAVLNYPNYHTPQVRRHYDHGAGGHAGDACILLPLAPISSTHDLKKHGLLVHVPHLAPGGDDVPHTLRNGLYPSRPPAALLCVHVLYLAPNGGDDDDDDVPLCIPPNNLRNTT